MKTKIIFSIVFTLMSYLTYAASFESGTSLVNGWRKHKKIINSQPGEQNYLEASHFVGYVDWCC